MIPNHRQSLTIPLDRHGRTANLDLPVPFGVPDIARVRQYLDAVLAPAATTAEPFDLRPFEEEEKAGVGTPLRRHILPDALERLKVDLGNKLAKDEATAERRAKEKADWLAAADAYVARVTEDSQEGLFVAPLRQSSLDVGEELVERDVLAIVRVLETHLANATPIAKRTEGEQRLLELVRSALPKLRRLFEANRELFEANERRSVEAEAAEWDGEATSTEAIARVAAHRAGKDALLKSVATDKRRRLHRAD